MVDETPPAAEIREVLEQSQRTVYVQSQRMLSATSLRDPAIEDLCFDKVSARRALCAA
jgi:hypothetical protein